MLNYLASEIFLIKKARSFKLALLAGIFFLAYLSITYFIYTQSPPPEGEASHIAYLEGIGDLIYFVGFVIGVYLINLLYKDKDYYRIALSSGKRKLEMMIENLFVLQIFSIVILILFLIAAVLINLLLAEIMGFSPNLGLKFLVENFKNVILLQLLLNQHLIGVIYLTGNKVISFTTVLVLLVISTPIKYFHNLTGQILRIVFPYYYFLENQEMLTINYKFLILYVINAILFVGIGYLGFRRREY